MTTPVTLYGTQSNGETLPVQVDATGRLVAEGLQGEKGDPGENGVGELPPNPQEGQALGWVNGELGWLDISADPVIGDCYLDTGVRNNPGENGFRNEAGELTDPPIGWDNAARDLSNWDTAPGDYPQIGVSTQTGNANLALNWDLTNALGKVLEIKYYIRCYKVKSAGQSMDLNLNVSTTDNNLQPIRVAQTNYIKNTDPGWVHTTLTAQYLCNRDEYQNVPIDCVGSVVNAGGNDFYVCCHGWKLVDPGRIALERQLAFENALRSSTPLTRTRNDYGY